MHCFVLKAKGLDLTEVKLDLQRGSSKSNYFFQPLNMSHRRCFDLVRAFHCVRPELSPFEPEFYLGTSGFSHPELFVVKYSAWIQLHLNVKSAKTFLNQQEKSMIYENDKAVMLGNYRTEEEMDAINELRKELIDSLKSHHGYQSI